MKFKKILILLISICCFGMVACNDSIKVGLKSPYEIIDSSIKMIVDEGTVTKTGAKIILKNNSDEIYQYGPYFELEIYKHNSWYSIYPLKQQQNFLFANILEQYDVVELNINWKEIYGSLPNGKYRIVKSVSKSDEVQKDIYISAEFQI